MLRERSGGPCGRDTGAWTPRSPISVPRVHPATGRLGVPPGPSAPAPRQVPRRNENSATRKRVPEGSPRPKVPVTQSVLSE